MSERNMEAILTEAGDNFRQSTRQGYGLTVCLLWNRLLIHRKTIRALGDPRRVRLLINPETHHFCVQGCDEKEACSFAVPREMMPVYDPFYSHSKFLLGQIYAMMAWDPSHSYRVFGKINTSTLVMDFDLNRYVQVHGDEHLENDEVPEEFMQEYRRPGPSEDLDTPAQGFGVIPDAPDACTGDSAFVSPGQAAPLPLPGDRPLPASDGYAGGLFDSVKLPGGSAAK